MKPILFTFAFAATLAAPNFIQKIAGSPYRSHYGSAGSARDPKDPTETPKT